MRKVAHNAEGVRYVWSRSGPLERGGVVGIGGVSNAIVRDTVTARNRMFGASVTPLGTTTL